MRNSTCDNWKIVWLMAGIVSSVVGASAMALPPDPNNAALLYYQACSICPELSSEVDAVIRGREPNERVREYLNQPACRETIELVQAAIQMPRCDWGILYSRGVRLPTPVHFALNRLSFLLGAHARTLAADGQYRSALDSCIGMRRFASHIGDDSTLMWTLSEKMAASGVSAIQCTLGWMPPDEPTLTWLKGKLNSVPGAPWRPDKVLKNQADMEIQRWTVCPREREDSKKQFLDAIEDDKVKQEIEGLPESELVARACASLDSSLRRAVEILTMDVPYREKQARLAQFVDQIEDKAKHGDPVACLAGTLEFADKYYRMHVNALASFNAVVNAVEVYLVKARTGQLPKELPAGLPPDPYSGESFKYEITKEGFILHCRAKSVDYSEVRRFEFRVRGQR